ncbi:hypothetical protein N780_17440 [Pontibacillus chungwhensis BH030062]|uniref:Uncharacterized protein n=1 Tax=Pontibacillus chungwhensis BH030062 TaxID=1385513 RepID=A0A0A2UX77_9BACI|nr:hypothetical protein [Pontibacillus chungwhensis]KGP91141.1 hypothetical protein N780_17440 [Pontibacillus chungwhensis BH030062]
MIYALFAVIALFLAYMIIRTDRKREEVEEEGHMSIISNYIVMEIEDEEQFEKSFQPLKELSEQYSWFEPGHMLCRVDLYGDHYEETWEGLLANTRYNKEQEPYFLFFEHKIHAVTQSDLPWKALVFETASLDEAKQFVSGYGRLK